MDSMAVYISAAVSRCKHKWAEGQEGWTDPERGENYVVLEAPFQNILKLGM